MTLPHAAHFSRPWRIHELTRDFGLEDVWALPTPGGPDDFPRLVAALSSWNPAQTSSLPARGLFALRERLGALFGWDDEATGLAGRVTSVRSRMPADLAAAPVGPDSFGRTFTSLFLLEDEWAAELANETVHGVVHIGWVPDGDGGYRGQMAILVKPNGLLGRAYMLAIKPFRHLLIYPQMLRQIEQLWNEQAAVPPAANLASSAGSSNLES